MIATAEEYLSKLWQLHNGNIPCKTVLLPSDEPIYEIDLNSRTIKAPYLSGIKKDQSAETFYFIVDRFHGEVDLINTGCLVYYKNKTNGTGGFYPVPFYDVTTFSTYVTNTYIEVELNDTNYKPNKFYIKNDEEYVLATDTKLDKSKTYYEFNDTSKNRKYEKVRLTEKTYQPNMYYYFDNKGENPSLSYILDERADFHEDEDYYAYIEARYINAHVEYSNYKPRKYYLLQGDQFVLDIGPYNKEVDYYSLIDQPKILFPWTIKSPATDAAGELEFAIKFYQVKNYSDSEIDRDDRLVYNLGTKTALTRIQDTLDVEIKDEDFEDDVNTNRENAPDYWEFLGGNSATVLEDIYYRLQILERQNEIYWIEA